MNLEINRYEKFETPTILSDRWRAARAAWEPSRALEDFLPGVFDAGPIKVGLKAHDGDFFLHVIKNDGAARVLGLGNVPIRIWRHLAAAYCQSLRSQGETELAERFEFRFPITF